ncbi:MAG: phytanoyl-CoA dioxygenase [Pedobacter sp.]|nr:MAG: phytanoyl-CoA dioxygenase [Pedobacter sp.]
MHSPLTNEQISSFISDGFIRIDNAFSNHLALEARNILWKDLPVDPHDPNSWTSPTIWLGMYSGEPFISAASSPALKNAFDQLIGRDNWHPCTAMGSFPIRFPSQADPGDTGWHVDASFPGEDPNDYFSYRVNLWSKGRALLMLFLFSDVGKLDAPTRILKGSHQDVARLLQPAGEKGLSFSDLAEELKTLPSREEVLATGKAGTVYLCHPFIVHAGQRHKGTSPKFMAQPPLFPKGEFVIDGKGPFSPVEQAIRSAISDLC